MRRETPDLLPVEHVKDAKLLHGLLAEAGERNVHELAAELTRELTVAGPRRRRAEDRDVTLAAVKAAGGDQSLFERIGEVEPAVAPDVANAPRREKEHCAAIVGDRDSRTDQVFH